MSRPKRFYNLYLPTESKLRKRFAVTIWTMEVCRVSKKFRYYQTRLLGEPERWTKKAIKKLAAHFSELVLEGVINAPFVPDVEKSSSGEKRENGLLRHIGHSDRRNAVDCRKNAVSRPVSRVYSALRKANRTGARHCLPNTVTGPKKTLFIGDAKSDYNAARENKLTFLLRRHNDNKEIFSDYNGLAIEDSATSILSLTGLTTKTMKYY